jgi:hypothetical protein
LNSKLGDESPLHCAARAGQLDAVRLLVEHGADVHARDRNFDGTPLSFANYKGQRRVVEYGMAQSSGHEPVHKALPRLHLGSRPLRRRLGRGTG